MPLSPSEKAARRQDAQDRLAARAEYDAAMAGGRGLTVPQAPEAPAYRVTTLTSAVTTKARAVKAARTRRIRAAALKAAQRG
jgi:hypothetical protein